jgi:hypothetical protein
VTEATSEAIDRLAIASPKRTGLTEEFQIYPYYAGYPETFVRTLLNSATLTPSTVIYDPWNGSGTTTSTATAMGHASIGLDINPAMIVVAKSRIFPGSEASSLASLCSAVIKGAQELALDVEDDEPLLAWFSPASAKLLRALERSCGKLFISRTEAWRIDQISTLAAVFYTALFAVARKLASPLRSANPTWIRAPKQPCDRIRLRDSQLSKLFAATIDEFQKHILAKQAATVERRSCDIRIADATTTTLGSLVDWVITSPPYCTRIDYAAATYIELALLRSLLHVDVDQLRSSMIGTTKVPVKDIVASEHWGTRCNQFLEAVRSHRSKASKGYYYRTHLDYFDKMYRSIENLSAALKSRGTAVLVVQDSYYKELHNDLPGIVMEIAKGHGLDFRRRADFKSKACMSRVNTRAVAHSTRAGSTESVLCFTKQ